MVKSTDVTTAKATVTPKICHKCRSAPSSTSNLCVACISFLSRVFAPNAPLIDRELATILNTQRPRDRERAGKNLATSLNKNNGEL